MEPSARLYAFKKIKAHFDALDREGLRHGKLPMHTTDFGFWGTTNMNDAYDFFSRIRLERFKRFVDLGCGDGRIVLIASLFTDAVGIEGDLDLVKIGDAAMKELDIATASGHLATLKNKDYYTEDFTQYDIIFMFPDRKYDTQMMGKLLTEFKGHLFVYNRIHAPPGVKSGKVYWVEQLPIASYAFGVEEKNLEVE